MADDPAAAVKGGLGDAWNLLKPNLVTFAIATLVAGIIGGVSFGICMGPMMGGLTGMVLKAKRGEKVEIGDLFKGFERFVDYLVVSLVGIVPLVGGLIVMWAMPYCVDKKADFMTSIKYGLNFFLKFLIPTLIAVVIAIVLYIAGLIACGVGLLVTMPLFLHYTVLFYLANESSVDPNAKPEVKTS